MYFLPSQASGVSVGPDGHPVVFHRGDRKWDQDSFDNHDNYTGPDYPIPQEAVIKVDRELGEIISSVS